MEKGKIAELVVYKLKEDQIENLDLVISRVNKMAASAPGFVTRVVHQSPEDRTKFMDYVIWDSLEQAQAATKAGESNATMGEFMQIIEQIETFQYFELK